MNIAGADSVAAIVTRLFDAATHALPNPLVYANFSRQCTTAQRRSLLSRNAPRRATLPAVNLLRYDTGTLVHGDRSYLTVSGDTIVREQLAPWCSDPIGEARLMRASPAIDIARPCLLLARFGENTWGHWVMEMLAKAAIAERLAPGRFSYVVPWWTTEPGGAGGLADGVLGSLAAYGIAPDRLVRAGSLQLFRFAALHDISGIGGAGLHPGVRDSLRQAPFATAAPPPSRRIALLRRPPASRAVFNADQVTDTLRADGFHLADPLKLTFLDQALLFAEAEVVVGSLGSDVWGSLFSPPGASLVTLAPSSWEDGYFIRLFQDAGARHADLRGPSTLLHANDPLRSPHLADPDQIMAGIAATSRPETEDVLVDGEPMPRRLGREILRLAFGATGNAAPFVRGAWSTPEASLRWSLGPYSEIALPGPGTPCWLEIVGQGHVYPPHLPTRPLQVLANGQEIGRFEVIGRTRLFCRLPAIDGPLVVRFAHPICPSPRSMGAGDDDRPLGFGFELVGLHAAGASVVF